MPAESVPTVQDFLSAAEGGIRGKNDAADLHEGSSFDIWRGVSAVLFARAAQRAQQNFHNIYLDTATGYALDEKVARQYPEVSPRVLATAGSGTATLARPSAAAGAGSFLKGTRIGLYVGNNPPRFYLVANTKSFTATQLEVVLNVVADVSGTGQAVNATSGGPNGERLLVEDAVFDPTFVVQALSCADGTDEETPAQFKSRLRSERLASRTGYAEAIVKRMQAAGAEEVWLLPSDFFGDEDDHGLNHIFVADASFSTSDALLRACREAAFDCAMCGMAVQVRPMQRTQMTLEISVRLWEPISSTSLDVLREDIRRRAAGYMADNPILWRIGAIVGAIRELSDTIADVEVHGPTVEPNSETIAISTALSYYVLDDNDCTISFVT